MTEPTLPPSRNATLIVEPVSLEASFDGLIAAFWRHWRVIVGAAVATAAVVTVYTLVRPRTYTATASFISQSKNPNSNFGGLAAQFGIALPADMAGDSPQFYVDLISSREILDSVAAPDYSLVTPSGVHRVTLERVYHASAGETPAQRRAFVIRKLREHLTATIGKQTGVVNLAVTTPDPYLSRAVAARILDEINRFNLHTRQSRATAERAFTEGRLSAAQSDLQTAEGRLEQFLQTNRDYRSAPRLALEYNRLSRDVSTSQALVTTLTQAYEQAKIDEVRDTPVITVLDTPEVPPNPDPRGLATKIIFSVLAGALIGAALAWVRQRRR